MTQPTSFDSLCVLAHGAQSRGDRVYSSERDLVKTTGRIGRGLAAAGTIAALTAGGLLAATPAIAAETPSAAAAVEGDRVIGYLTGYGNSTLAGVDWTGSTSWATLYSAGNSPQTSSQVSTGLTQAQFDTKLAAEIATASSKGWLRWSIPASGTTGQIKTRNAANTADGTLCLVAPAIPANPESSASTSWSTCSTAANQQWSVASNKSTMNQSTFTIHSVATGQGLNYNGAMYPLYGGAKSSRLFSISDPVEQLVEREVVVTSPEDEATVGSKGFDLTGTAQPNADVEVRAAAAVRATGELVGTTKADASGAWKLENVQLPTGRTVLTATAGTKSATITVLVIDDTANIVLSSPSAGDKVIGSGVLFEGTAEPGATVSILDHEGNEVGTAVADATTGAFSVEVILPEGSTSASVEVGERKVDVKDLAVVAELKVTTPKAGETIGTNGTEFTGTGEPGDTVEIKGADGTTIGSTTVKPDGSWTTTVKVPEGAAPITIIADGQEIVLDDVQVEDDTAPLEITSPKAGDEIVGPDVKFEGKGQPGEKVEIKDADGNVIGETEVNSDGTWDVVVTVPENGSVVVEAGDQKVEIKDLDVVAPLKVLTPKAGDTIGTNGADFTGTGQPGATVEIKDADGNAIGETEVKGDGTWDLNVKVPEGSAPISVITGGQIIVLDDVQVEDDTAPLEITSPKAGDEIVGPDVKF
ncbi:Ig-like domain-containing protein, partial [Microbacterium sp. NPDC055988]|uniref:Ig-like domain-containing protein n=1 Tax=Microbacterium sp. NPDC055988 TaxID=3345671 RepID=UPI0035DF38D1